MTSPIPSYPKGGQVNPKGLTHSHFLMQLLGGQEEQYQPNITGRLEGYPVQTQFSTSLTLSQPSLCFTKQVA